MAERPWIDFLSGTPAGHLVSASVEPVRSPQHLGRLRRMLARLIRDDAPAGDFATSIVRPTGIVEIRCGFADKADADRFARIVGARAAPAESVWTSHRRFRLDAAKELKLAGILPSPRRERAAPSSEQPL